MAQVKIDDSNNGKKIIPQYSEEGAVEKLIELIEENKLNVRRDEKYLYKVLKSRDFNYDNALRTLKNYDQFVSQDRDFWLNFKKSDIKSILGSGVLSAIKGFDNETCRIVWIRAGIWDPKKQEPDLVLKVAGLLMELVIQESTPEQLGKGCKIIFDMSQVGLKHMYGVSSKFAKNMVHFLSKCLLMPVRRVHNVNEPRIFSLLYAIFRVFLDDHTQKYINFHGSDLTNFQNILGVQALPNELGGTSKAYELSHWMNLIETPEIRKELALSGYTIEED